MVRSEQGNGTLTAHPFDDWADIYDQVYAYLTYDLDFYVEQAVASKGPVLELGCGTGRVSLAMAGAGIDVVGVDISPRMVEVARAKAKEAGLSERCRFQAGDMRDLALRGTFPLVVMPFRSFQSMLTVADQRAALAVASAHLAPGGLLAMDIFAPDLHMLATDDATPFHVRDVPQPDTGPMPNTGGMLVVWGQNRWDPLRQVNRARLIIEELDAERTVVRRLYRDFDLRYTFRYEMMHLLERCGFTVEALYGDFEGGPVAADSDDLVWLARQGAALHPLAGSQS